MSRFVLIYILILATVNVFPQGEQNECGQSSRKNAIYTEHLTGRLYVNPDPGVEKQFFNPWLDGDITLVNGSIVTNKKIRYNGLEDELIWIRELDYQMVEVAKEKVKGFTIYKKDGTTLANFIKMDVNRMNRDKKGQIYLEVFVNGDISLYAHRKIGLLKNRKEYFNDVSYYLEKDNTLHKINLNRWGLFRLFPDRKKDIRSTIRSQRLFIRNETGMKRIVEMINQK